jgi:hypothetical protein
MVRPDIWNEQALPAETIVAMARDFARPAPFPSPDLTGDDRASAVPPPTGAMAHEIPGCSGASWHMRPISSAGLTHRRNVMHRHGEPGNIMYQTKRSAAVTVAGFGAARFVAVTGMGVGMVLGTACPMPPDRRAGQRAFGRRPDPFPVGVIFRHQACRPLPSQAQTMTQLMNQTEHEPPVGIRSREPGLRARAGGAAVRAFARSEARCLRTGEEMAHAIHDRKSAALPDVHLAR